MSELPHIHWNEAGNESGRSARWQSEAGVLPPRRVVPADDRMTADEAYRLASQGTGLLWRGDFQNARQLLNALTRRVASREGKSQARHKGSGTAHADRDERTKAGAHLSVEDFNRIRMMRAQRARLLGMLLIPFDVNEAAEYVIPLRRSPAINAACMEAWGAAKPGAESFVASLRELLGLIGAHEWRTKGVAIPALGARIHPHYGVYSPVRGEYLDLVARAPLPAALSATNVAFDVGTGTGVLAAILARRGAGRVIATDRDPRALACARDNLTRLAGEGVFSGRIEVVEADLYPEGQAALIVCNPPWLPGRAATPLEHAIYDQDSRMLRGFLTGLAAHLVHGGEGWLILSDLAEHLGLRARDELLALFEASHLSIAGRIDARPRHPKAADKHDPLHAARSREITSLWRLVPDGVLH